MCAAELYAIPLGSQLTPAERAGLVPYIPAEKRDRLGAFRHWQDAQRTLLGYSMLSYLLAKRTGTARERLKLTFDYYGKPHLTDGGIYFNLSHSGDWIVCAVADVPIGVDVEKIQPIELELAHHFFARSEVSDLMALPEESRQEYFFTLWSLKESYIKAEGRGVSIPLDSFWFTIKADGTIGFDSAQHETHWRFKLYEFDRSYKLAVCAGAECLPVQVQLLSLTEIKGGSVL